MSRHVHDQFAKAVHMVEAWADANGGYNYANARWLNFGTNEQRRCYLKWSAAERRAAHAIRHGRRHRAMHHRKEMTRWFMRSSRASAIAIRNLP